MAEHYSFITKVTIPLLTGCVLAPRQMIPA